MKLEAGDGTEAAHTAVPAGQLRLESIGESVECALVLMQDAQIQLLGLISGNP